MSSERRLSSAHRQTRQIVEALRSGKSGGIADLVASVEPAKQHGGTGANQYSKDDECRRVNYPSANERKGSRSPERIIARLKRDAESDPKAEALLGKTYRQPASDRKKPSTATLPLERGEVLAKGG